MLKGHFYESQMMMQPDADGFTCIECTITGQKMYNPMKNKS